MIYLLCTVSRQSRVVCSQLKPAGFYAASCVLQCGDKCHPGMQEYPLLKEEISHRIGANPTSRLWDVWGGLNPQTPRGFAFGWKSAIRAGWPKIQVEAVAPTKRSSSHETRLDGLSYSIKIWTDLHSVLSQSTRLTDRRTDGQTEFSALDRLCISCSALKMTTASPIRCYTGHRKATKELTQELLEQLDGKGMWRWKCRQWAEWRWRLQQKTALVSRVMVWPLLKALSQVVSQSINLNHSLFISGNQSPLASCLIYARAFLEYICGCILFQDVTVREIRGK